MPDAYRIITAEQAERWFSVSADVEYPYQKFPEQEIRLYAGDLYVAGDFEPDSDGDWCEYNTIVDGDLTVDGDLVWWDWAGGCFLLVTGTVRARNLLLQGCPNVVVRGDLIVSGGIQGHRGDDGGLLVVGGRTTATIVLNTLYFGMEFGENPDAIVVGDEGRTNCPVDFDEEELAGVAMPELLEAGGERADEYKVTDALRADRPVLRPTAIPSHLATRAELDRLLADPAQVTELDLSDRKLRAFPEQLFRFPNLRRLSLAGNDLIEALPERIDELASLVELDVSRMGLTGLPAAIGRLRALRVLDLSHNPLAAVPPQLGNLPRLETLRAHYLTCPLPDELGRLTSLVELDLYGLDVPPGERHRPSYRGARRYPLASGGYGGDELYGRAATRPVPFPVVVTRLSRLRRLDLSKIRLDSLPDSLLRLTNLEELVLDGAVGLVDRLPDLRRLPRLCVLHINGSRANYGRYPDPAILSGVWPISTLEELGLSRWGEETEYDPATRRHETVRAALAALPDGAFAGMPRLRRLDLSFNTFTTLPDSFYTRTELAEVDLRYTALSSATVDRLITTFPRVRLDLRHVKGGEPAGPADPQWRAVHGLVATGAERLRDGDRTGAITSFEEALARCVPGACYAEYDQLYALYGLVDALGHLRLAVTGTRRAALSDQLAARAEQALSLVPAPGTTFHLTDLGAFQEEVTRRAGNALAWLLMERGELTRALHIADRALAVANGAESDYIRDTKVRILLAAGRDGEAYQIVDQVLTRDPDFDDFHDLRESPGFLAWRVAHRAAA
jgi:Leucine-rich repeat (LRR) protein